VAGALEAKAWDFGLRTTEMPLYTTDALILRTYKLGEADRIVVFLTADRGKKRGVAKGARRTKSRFGGALEPLTHAGVTYFEKERRELVSLNYADTVRSPWSARNLEALGHIEYFAELIDEWAPEGDPSPRLFRLGTSLVGALAAGAPVDPLARYFEYWLLRLQGVYPAHVRCHSCGADLGEGDPPGACLEPAQHGFTCLRCARLPGGVPAASVSREALTFLERAGRTAPERVGDLAAPARAMRELEAVHRTLIAWHLEREPKSARVLRELRG
jgi:DNA repair protein RecO (recombination protein O)